MPRTQLSHIALLENEEAIQVSLMQVMNGLMSGAIDLRRGELILRALNTAVRNSLRVRFNTNRDRMVTEVPHYEQDAASRDRSRQEVRAEIARMRAETAKQLGEKSAAGNSHPPAESAGRVGQPGAESNPHTMKPALDGHPIEVTPRHEQPRYEQRDMTKEHGTFVIEIEGREASYNAGMQRKVFWMSFTLFGLLADFLLPFWWALGATLPIMWFSWWVAYRSDWF